MNLPIKGTSFQLSNACASRTDGLSRISWIRLPNVFFGLRGGGTYVPYIYAPYVYTYGNSRHTYIHKYLAVLH